MGNVSKGMETWTNRRAPRGGLAGLKKAICANSQPSGTPRWCSKPKLKGCGVVDKTTAMNQNGLSQNGYGAVGHSTYHKVDFQIKYPEVKEDTEALSSQYQSISNKVRRHCPHNAGVPQIRYVGIVLTMPRHLKHSEVVIKQASPTSQVYKAISRIERDDPTTSQLNLGTSKRSKNF